MWHKITLENFGRFQKKEIELNPGTTAIVGPNGCGKSTILGALELLVTGSVTSLFGNKKDRINLAAGDKQVSSVTGLYQDREGNRWKVVRGVNKRTSSMTRVNKEKGEKLETIRGDKAVTAKLTELTGTDVSRVAPFVFVPQGRASELFGTSTARTKEALNTLFGTHRLKLAEEALADTLKAFPEHSTTEGEAIYAARASAQQSLDVLNAWLEAHPSAAVDVDEADPLREQIASLESRTTRAHKYNSVVARMKASEEQLESLKNELLQKTTQRVQLEAAKPKFEQAYVAAKQRINNAAVQRSSRDVLLRQKESREHRAAQLASELAAIMVVPPARTDAEGIDRDIDRVKIDLNMKQQLSELPLNAPCPTCHQTSATFEEEKQKARPQVPVLQQQLRVLQDERMQLVAYQTNTLAAGNKQAMLELEQEAIAKLDTEIPPEVVIDPGDERLVAQFEQLVSRLSTLAAEIPAAERTVSVCEKQHEDLVIQEKELKAEGDVTMPVGDVSAEIAQLREQLRKKQELRTQYIQKQGQKVALENTLAANPPPLQDVGKVAARKKLIEELQAARALLHRDVLPEKIRTFQVRRICGRANALLQKMNVPYALGYDDDGNFTAATADGSSLFGLLSGGQQTLTSFAFLLEANLMEAAGASLFCQDEPAAFLDQANRAQLPAFIDRMRNAAKAAKVQCVIVTHHPLGGAVDHVVEL